MKPEGFGQVETWQKGREGKWRCSSRGAEAGITGSVWRAEVGFEMITLTFLSSVGLGEAIQIQGENEGAWEPSPQSYVAHPVFLSSCFPQGIYAFLPSFPFKVMFTVCLNEVSLR